ncbi:unnamed protein product [Symbiodinium sp. CCMP2456]|nr:unnamed protein product [Symbiodinium sp. CCMP2456]
MHLPATFSLVCSHDCWSESLHLHFPWRAMEKGSMSKLLWESDVLMWERPAVTGAVFSMFNIFFLAVFYWDLSLVPALCHIFTVVLLAGGAIRYAVPQTADRNVDLLSQDAIKSAVETISKFLNVISEKVRDVVLWTSSEMTITAVFVLQLVRLVSPYFGAFFFVWMIGNVLFVAPYVWKAKNAELHQYVGPYIKQAVAIKDDLLAKVPKYTDVVKEECSWHLGYRRLLRMSDFARICLVLLCFVGLCWSWCALCCQVKSRAALPATLCGWLGAIKRVHRITEGPSAE